MVKRILAVLLIGMILLTLLPTAGMARVRVSPRNPLLYGLASFILPGVGQFLNDEPDKALVHFVVAVALPTVVTIVGHFFPWHLQHALLGLLSLGWHTYSAIDAYRTADRFNARHGFAVNSLRREWAAIGIEQNSHLILAPVINPTFALNFSRWERAAIGLNEHNHNFGLCWVGNTP
jgi:hypothetical protein